MAGKVDHPPVERGIAFLVRMQAPDGLWDEQRSAGAAIFYLRYHGCLKFFPVWTMARYSNLTNAKSRSLNYGM